MQTKDTYQQAVYDFIGSELNEKHTKLQSFVVALYKECFQNAVAPNLLGQYSSEDLRHNLEEFRLNIHKADVAADTYINSLARTSLENSATALVHYNSYFFALMYTLLDTQLNIACELEEEAKETF